MSHIISDCYGMEVDPNDWPAKGQKVFFLDFNGYDSELEQARKFMVKDQGFTVKLIHVGRSSSKYIFEELPNQRFNTVMFTWAGKTRPKPEPMTVAELAKGSALAKEYVWVATIEHRHGTDVYVNKTEDGLNAEIAAYIRMWWAERNDTDAPDTFPEEMSHHDLVMAYFGDGEHPSESLDYLGQVELGA